MVFKSVVPQTLWQQSRKITNKDTVREHRCSETEKMLHIILFFGGTCTQQHPCGILLLLFAWSWLVFEAKPLNCFWMATDAEMIFVFQSNWSASRADIEGGGKLWTNAKCKGEVKVFTCTAPVLSGRWGQGPACHQWSGKSCSLQKRMWPPQDCRTNSLSLISHERGLGQDLGNCRR